MAITKLWSLACPPANLIRMALSWDVVGSGTITSVISAYRYLHCFPFACIVKAETKTLLVVDVMTFGIAGMVKAHHQNYIDACRCQYSWPVT